MKVIRTAELQAATSARAVLANADALRPMVALEAAASEQEGQLTSGLAQAFREAGLYEMGFPKRLGGLEMSLADQMVVVSKIARVDAGIGWNVGVLNATGFYASRLGDAAYAKLYPTRDMPTSGSFHPRGRADVVDGGYLVTGRWSWGSGSQVAEHVIGGCLVFDQGEPVIGPSGQQLVLGLWLPPEAIIHADDWHSLGIRSSGSSSYSIDESVFIPAGHAFDREPLPNPDSDPLNKHVTLAFFGLTGVCVGLAQHVVDLTQSAVLRRAGTAGISSLDTATRKALGQALAAVDHMFAAVTDIARRTDEIIFTPGQILSPAEEVRLPVANALAGETLRRVIDVCLELYGTRYLFDADPMQRVLRDAHTALAHKGTWREHWIALADAVLDDPGSPTLSDAPWDPTSL